MTTNLLSKLASRLITPIDRLAYQNFYDYPLGRTPRASAEEYQRLWLKAKSETYPLIDAYEKQLGCQIDQEWMHNLALTTQIVIKQSDLCYQHGRLLYATLLNYIKKGGFAHVYILETGTARGFSALCMARALNDAGQPGAILTFDVLPHNVSMYWNCIHDFRGPQTRAELLKDYTDLTDRYILFHQGDTRLELRKLHLPHVHLAFLDGLHTYEAVMLEFAYVHARQQPGDLIFFDDYTPALFPGIVKAVDEICARHNYSKTVLALSEQRGYVIAQKQ